MTVTNVALSSALLSSRELRLRLRHDVRVSLHQVISLAEIIIEDAGDSSSTSFVNVFYAAIAEAERTLRTVNSSTRNSHESHLELVKHCERLRAIVMPVQSLTADSPIHSDLLKLQAALSSFESAAQQLASATQESSKPYIWPGSGENQGASVPSSLLVHGRLLVVDDNEGNREVLARRLLRDNCDVFLAENGKQALKMVRRYDFDLVLLDIIMPDLDGFAVLRDMKSDPKLRHIPVVMISAMDEIDSVVRCIAMGAEDYLFKPFDPVLLRARIGALLDRKRLQDDEQRKNEELRRAFEEIQRQRQRSEDLLLNILPESVAAELKSTGHVKPIYFDDVTIVFADFVGFTISTEHLSAQKLVQLLHQYFSAFDRIIARYGLEKLKTIGDCYMFAGGVPVRSASHCVDSVLAALEMIDTVRQLSKAGEAASWRVRVGIHTGPAIAGVVGIHKFVFDIWGDAVNLASRMEASGEPDRVNLSSAAFARAKDFFSCEKRGRIQIKDKREVEMYFADCITPELLAVEGGSQETAFAERYRLYFNKNAPALPDCLLHPSV
jgi:adenylate cyclase